MPRRPRDQIRPGMILSAAVHDRNGRLLMAAGGELTVTHLRIFQTWGIPEVEVAGDQETGPDVPEEGTAVDPEELLQAEEQVKKLFCRADTDHPVVKELMKLAIIRKVNS